MEINEYIICNNISDVCSDAICVDIMGFISKGTKKEVGKVSTNFAAAKNGKVGSNFSAAKNGQVSSNSKKR